MTAGRTIRGETTSAGAGAPHLAYRPEIDGLRAIAVLAVVLYHFGVPGLGGGFVGVDVFFVISGFLIGGLLWRELDETGRVSLRRFYVRRIRRLAPAYLAMAAVTTLAAWAILLPYEFREFGKHLIAATLWLSNVQFWREAGYFDAAGETKALLHTWSLSVEEQFYLLVPATLLVLRFSRRLTLALLVFAWALSLGSAVALTPSEPVATFFLFPFRAWELLTGVLLAYHFRQGGQILPRWLGAAGLVLVLLSILFVRPEGFPGWQAILPVAGTAMLLAQSGRGGLVNDALSLRGPVFVGLVSYALYLWHWPVLVLSTYWRGAYSGPLEAAGWLALAAGLAVASWALIERPLRRSATLAPRRVVMGSGIVAASVVAVGAIVFLRDGVPSRFGPEARGHIAASQDFLQDWSRCAAPAEGPFAGIELCAIGPEGAPPEVVIWGDSHLRALMNGIGLAAQEARVPGVILWTAGCPPLFGIAKTESAATPAEDAACTEKNDRLRAALPTLGAERILLVGRWSYYAEGAGLGRDAENRIALRPAAHGTFAATDQRALFAEALAATVAELRQSFDSVHVLRQVPEIAQYDSRAVAKGLAHGTLPEADAARLTVMQAEPLAARMRAAEQPIYALAAAGAVTVIDSWQALCAERCSALLDGVPVYFDNNHLTNRGAVAIRFLFLPFLTGTTP